MYDIIILGAGPSGLTAGIYAALANKKVLVLEKNWVGGQVAITNSIKNYPGFEQVDGFTLAEKIKQQALSLNVEIKNEEVVSVNLKDDIKLINTHKSNYQARAVIVAMGAGAKQLDVLNEKKFIGRGVSYCATCDGGLYKNKTIAVVGGGNTSLDDCVYLSNLAKKIYLIHRRDVFTGNQSTLNKVKALAQDDQKIEILTNYVVEGLYGEQKLEKVKIKNKITDETKELLIDGLFVAIGRKADTEIFEKQLKLNESGFIITDENMRTNLKNVYAIGDVRNTPLRQIVTACADGAVAVTTFIKDN